MLKIAHELKKYFLPKLKLEKTQNSSRTTTNKQVGFLILEVGIAVVVINNCVGVIQV